MPCDLGSDQSVKDWDNLLVSALMPVSHCADAKMQTTRLSYKAIQRPLLDASSSTTVSGNFDQSRSASWSSTRDAHVSAM